MSFRPCIVVPVYNHGAEAGALAERLAPTRLPTLIVDDGSDAATVAELATLMRRHGWIQVLRHAENAGKGAAVMTGLRRAGALGFSHALQIDADGQHDTDDIPRFLAAAEAHPRALVAGRPIFDASQPKARYLARYLTHIWVWIETLSFTIRDSMCGFRVYPLAPVSELMQRARIGRRMDFDTEVMVRLHWQGVAIVSLPTRVIYPAGGLSNFRPWHDNYLITRMHIRLIFGMLWRAPRLLARKLGARPRTA